METALGEEEALEPRQERALAAARDWVRQAEGTSSTPSSSRRAPPPPHVLTALSEAAWGRSHLALEVRARVQVRVLSGLSLGLLLGLGLGVPRLPRDLEEYLGTLTLTPQP